MTEHIDLIGLEVWARHGVFPAEQADSQKLMIDLSVMFDMASALASDDLGDTVDDVILQGSR